MLLDGLTSQVELIVSRPADHISPGQLTLLHVEPKPVRRKKYVPKYEGDFTKTNALLDELLARRKGLKPYEGRCSGCGKVISIKAPNCGRRSCPAVFPQWSRDQRRVVSEALREYGGLLILTDVTLPGTPEKERHRQGVALPWAYDGSGRVEAKALYKANEKFKKRMRWLKRKAYNDARAALSRGGYESKRLPPVLIGNLERQKRGALHAHLALPYTTPLLACVYRFDEEVGSALRARLCAGLEGCRALEAAPARFRGWVHDQVPDREAPARVPAGDQRAGGDRFEKAD